jgi:hypothetical protein
MGMDNFPVTDYQISRANGINYCYKLQVNLQWWVADIVENYKMHYDAQELIMNLYTQCSQHEITICFLTNLKLDRFLSQYKHKQL